MKIDKLLCELQNVPVPPQLETKLLTAFKRQQRWLKFKQTTVALATLITFYLTVFSFTLFTADWQQTASSQILKLAFTDPVQVKNSLSNWLLAVLESVPLTSLTFFMGTVFFFLMLLSNLLKKFTLKKVNLYG